MGAPLAEDLCHCKHLEIEIANFEIFGELDVKFVADFVYTFLYGNAQSAKMPLVELLFLTYCRPGDNYFNCSTAHEQLSSWHSYISRPE